MRPVAGFAVMLAWLVACAGSLPEQAPAPRLAGPVPAIRAPDDRVQSAARRPLETKLLGLPLPPIHREHPEVGRLRGRGSLSIGTTRDGFVVNCRPLPLEGPHHRVLPVQAARGTNCGTEELVAAILRAAEAVAKRYPGAVLPVGNLSRAGGGDIPWSISHNAGRDADIGLYLLDSQGRPFFPRDLVKLNRQGIGDSSGAPVRLDVRRTWWFLRSLMTDSHVEVQWLFIANWLRDLLLNHARESGERPEIVQKVAAAMAQPNRAFPHDDHVHVRLYCAPDDLYEGCQDRGSNRPWYVDRRARIEARVRELRPLLRAGSDDQKAAAVTVLARLGRVEFLPQFTGFLAHRSPLVRLAAAQALRELGVSGVESRVVSYLRRGEDPRLMPVLLDSLNRTLRGERRVEALGDLLGLDREFQVDLGVFQIRRTIADWALEEIEHSARPLAVPVLIRALRRNPTMAQAISEALVRVTGVQVADSPDPKAWEAWWRRNRSRPPATWVFEATGAPESSAEQGSRLRELMVLAVEDDPRSRAARDAIRKVLGLRWPRESIEAWSILIRAALGDRTGLDDSAAGAMDAGDYPMAGTATRRDMKVRGPWGNPQPAR